ncbi:ABC transporter permease [Porphyromonas macacae]|uniref:ABC transporter permease n=1 Tax=Porphyromonas macacae TaxID=28115 RepID=UPI003F953AD1
MFQGALLLHVIWFVAALLVDKPLLPGPVTVYRSIGTVLEKGLALHLAYSMRRVSVALLIAFGIGIGMALSMYRWPRFGRLMSSFVYFSYPIPKLALLPVVLLLLGMGETPKIVFIVLIILFQIIIALRDSLRSIPEEHFTAVRSMGLLIGKRYTMSFFPLFCPMPCLLCVWPSVRPFRCCSWPKPMARVMEWAFTLWTHGCVWIMWLCMWLSYCSVWAVFCFSGLRMLWKHWFAAGTNTVNKRFLIRIAPLRQISI